MNPHDESDPAAAGQPEGRHAGAAEDAALEHLLPAVYDELRRMAHGHLRGERPGHTLNTTSLVHEAYIRMAGIDAVDWTNRSQFLGMASRAMRRVLIDYARARQRRKRSPGAEAAPVESRVSLAVERTEDLLLLDDALARLDVMEPRQCRVVECRFFAGMTVEETATALRVSVATVKRDWTNARAWLNAELSALGVSRT